MTIDYEPSGYIKDDDAKEWDADELLQSLKDGTEAANEHRRDIGVAEIQVTRWVEKPAYDAQTHRLVWSAEAREKGGPGHRPGRQLQHLRAGPRRLRVAEPDHELLDVEADKPAAHELLAAVNFNDGKRYSDFNSSTDKVAAYGLAALVGGIAAKKLGLLAAAGLFIAKFAKVIIIGVAAAGAAVVKFLKGRNASQALQLAQRGRTTFVFAICGTNTTNIASYSSSRSVTFSPLSASTSSGTVLECRPRARTRRDDRA